MDATTQVFAERIRSASAERPLRIRGGGSKDFYGGPLSGDILDTRGHRGIVDYQPSELFITAKSGTPLAEIETALAEHGQMLAFEPPHFGPTATIGGCVASGISGPRRPHAGSIRDFVLGVHLLDGQARALRFGGQVMKNVAGFDVSRLMAGSLGTLGLLLEVSLKLAPMPRAECTLRFEMGQAQALEALNRWAGQPLPLSASAWCDGVLTLRLSGAGAAVEAACAKLCGTRVDENEAKDFWRDIREQRHRFFADGAPLWRLSLPSTTPPLLLDGPQLIEWNGAQRWLRSSADLAAIRAAAAQAGGHATLFRGASATQREAGVFHPPTPAIGALNARVRQVFDPRGVLNASRLSPPPAPSP